MPFPRDLHRIVVIGDLYGVEEFNFSLTVAPLTGAANIPASTQALTDAVGAAVATWYPKLAGSGGCSIIQQARLQSVKVNRLDPDGHYKDPVSFEAIVGPIQGGSGALVAPQLAMAVTLASVIPRGRGSKNRFYLPPLTAFATVDSTGRVSAANAGAIASGAKGLIDALNAVYAGFGGGFDPAHRVAVASSAGAGSFRDVAKIRVGRVIDTMRSRRSSLAEDYQEVTPAFLATPAP